ncbi:unnamed protein product [Staurois parvus]|uniref:Uncharacterized protein n=1 Tax=Staurois parvus TaxID=386267 RepID=A0ABN9E4A5_9NEOB|nr:unnamed protein product [Staurois parvus]
MDYLSVYIQLSSNPLGCQTGSPPAVAKLQVPSCLYLWESCL